MDCGTDACACLSACDLTLFAVRCCVCVFSGVWLREASLRPPRFVRRSERRKDGRQNLTCQLTDRDETQQPCANKNKQARQRSTRWHVTIDHILFLLLLRASVHTSATSPREPFQPSRLIHRSRSSTDGTCSSTILPRVHATFQQMHLARRLIDRMHAHAVASRMLCQEHSRPRATCT